MQAVLQLALTSLPIMNGLFGTAPILGDVWAQIFLVAVVAALVVAVHKRLTRSMA